MTKEKLIVKKFTTDTFQNGNWVKIRNLIKRCLSSNQTEDLDTEFFKLISDKESIVIYATRQDRILGLISLEKLGWDSAFFESSMSRIKYYMIDQKVTDATNIANQLLIRIVRKAKKSKISHITCRINSENFPCVWALENMGFHMMDIGITSTFNFKKHRLKSLDKKFEIRPSQDKDVNELIKIGRNSFKLSRFYADPFFTSKQADEFYGEWIRNLHRGLAEVVLVAELRNKLVGFITCSTDQKKQVGDIALFAVSSPFRKLGIGSYLIYEALKWFKDKVKTVRIRTQAINYPAINLYGRVGFKISQTDITFCKDLTKG